ncbi:hypothetical protein BSL78_18668 [Apostichopus japonicus]|uniref:Protein arginine N-methyltransferase 7 n=1 Tax=Stichopus japonicus TaxID=307972 RepID=A0A2G8K913_STIJA|nr:hypothetical protein BSL78_18668 [Apostichopus japonicus]
MQAVYFLPTSTEVEKGQSLDVTVSHDDYSLWFSVFNSSAQPVVERPICQCGAHVVWSRQRFAIMNQVSRNDKFISALKKVVNQSTTCMSISDGSLLPLIAARLGACQFGAKLYVSESHAGDCGANDLSGKVELIPQTAQDLKLEDKEYQIDLLVSEPFFTSGLLPWHSLYFWYCRTALTGHLAEGATILPCGARLRAVAVQFEHLWKFHAPVGDLEGFDVRIFDDLTQRAAKDTDAKEEPHHLWEYPGCPLTSDFDLMQFDFTSCIQTNPSM